MVALVLVTKWPAKPYDKAVCGGPTPCLKFYGLQNDQTFQRIDWMKMIIIKFMGPSACSIFLRNLPCFKQLSNSLLQMPQTMVVEVRRRQRDLNRYFYGLMTTSTSTSFSFLPVATSLFSTASKVGTFIPSASSRFIRLDFLVMMHTVRTLFCCTVRGLGVLPQVKPLPSDGEPTPHVRCFQVRSDCS